MQGKIEKKKFTPFDLQITVNTVEEARTLYHIFHCDSIDKIILDKNKWSYPVLGKYSSQLSDLSPEFASPLDKDLHYILSKEITSQGFKI